jgi:enediyne biosynthesis protein E4
MRDKEIEAAIAIVIDPGAAGAIAHTWMNEAGSGVSEKNLNEPPSLLRNDFPNASHWLKVQLIGVLAQSSYLSVNDRCLHFGLGAATSASLEIRWPNGTLEKLPGVAAGQLVVIREGAGIVRREPMGRTR